MLDASNAGFHRGAGTFVPVRVTEHEDPEPRRLLHHRAELCFRVYLLPRIGIGAPRPLGPPCLDYPRSVLDVDADQRAQVLFVLEGHGKTHEVGVGEDPVLDVGRHENAGPEVVGTGDVSRFRHPPEDDVAIGADARAPRGGDPRLERAEGAIEGVEMGVGVEETRENVAALEVDDFGAGRGRTRPYRDDLPVPQDDGRIGGDSARADVEDVPVDEGEMRLRQRLALREGQQE